MEPTLIEAMIEMEVCADITAALAALDAPGKDAVGIRGFWNAPSVADPPFVYVLVTPFTQDGYQTSNGKCGLTIMGKIMPDDDKQGTLKRAVYEAVRGVLRAEAFKARLAAAGVVLRGFVNENGESSVTDNGDVWSLSYKFAMFDNRK